jgi:hypothetical protein
MAWGSCVIKPKARKVLMMTNDEQSLIDRMCREALDRLARSIGTRVGIAKARLREAAASISEKQ